MIDEKKGRSLARKLNIEIIGSLKILLLAKQKGIINSVKEIVKFFKNHHIEGACLARLQKEKLGKMTREQKASLIILLLVLILMFAAPEWAGNDSYLETAVIAIFGGVSLFVIPKNRTEKFLNWSDMQKVPLGVLFILGAGLSLSLAFTTSGLADYLGTKLSALSILPFPVIVILIVSITMIIGNTMSNTATAAIFIPVVASMAALNHWPPLPFLAGITLSSSLAFLLPMGTPPNALVYEQGKIQIKEMIKNGIVLTIIAIIMISVFTIFLYPLLLPEISL